jgi:DNA-binding response OmpR family regulator
VEVPENAGSLLVVDDEPFLRDAVAASLRFLGFEVTAAETGADALRLARGRPFDLVVLDVMLPDTDGFEVRRDGHLIELSPTEFRLLRYLMLHPGRVLTPSAPWGTACGRRGVQPAAAAGRGSRSRLRRRRVCRPV